MEILTPYLILFAAIIFINAVPAFMPPTWSVLTFIMLRFKLDFFPTIFIGAAGALIGRIILYRFSEKIFRNFLDSESKINLEGLKKGARLLPRAY